MDNKYKQIAGLKWISSFLKAGCPAYERRIFRQNNTGYLMENSSFMFVCTYISNVNTFLVIPNFFYEAISEILYAYAAVAMLLASPGCVKVC